MYLFDFVTLEFADIILQKLLVVIFDLDYPLLGYIIMKHYVHFLKINSCYLHNIAEEYTWLTLTTIRTIWFSLGICKMLLVLPIHII